MLQRLYITNNEPINNEPMDEECAKNFVDSLPKDSELLTLNFGWTDGRAIDPALAAVPNLEKMVYDASSFDALCHSNHKLQHVGVTENNDPKPTELGRIMMARSPILRKALEINARETATDHEKIRSKLRAVYFQGQFDFTSFTDIDIGLIPNVLEFVTMSEVYIGRIYVKACEGNLDGIYRLIRNYGNLPSLFSFTSPQTEIQQLKSEMSSMKMEMEHLRLENEQLRSNSSRLQNDRSKV
mmetsp:Transcript_1479/g.2673  ORF Transcript_1479/g.2673 Transcript_1479/m.2673 type:complete len:241 (-) Transcript_1479:79-801(-)